MTQDKQLSEIAVKVGRLEVLQESSSRAIGEMASSVNRLVDKLDQSDDAAKEALDKAKSAHHRLNKIDKVIYWAGTTIVGAVVLGLIAMLVGGNKP